MTEERGRGAEEGGHGPHGSSAPRADILAAPPPAPPPESRPTRARAGEAPGGDPAVAAALDYLRRGWAPIPYARGTKRPSGAGAEGWPSWRFTPEEIPEKFGGKNVGILLGAPSGGLVDVDLDCPEAERAADLLLPRTGAVFGRKSKPESHRLYVAEPVPTTAKYQDPTDGATLLELRGHTTDGKPGLQTMFPGSVHPSGEPVEWRWTAEPAPPKVAAGDLAGRVKSLAAVALLARHLPPPKEKRSKGTPGRDDYLFAIAGWLLRAGWDVAKVEACLYAVATAAAMESPKERSKKAGKSKAALAKGKKTRGWTWLVSHIGEEVMEKAREWLGVEERKVALKPEAPPPPRVVESLEEVRRTIEARFHHPQVWRATHAGLAVGATLLLRDSKNPLGLNLIGPPSSEKSTVIGFFRDVPGVTFHSDHFTPKSFVTHAANLPREKLEEIDLLPKIRNRLFTISDLTALFGKRADDLLESISILVRIFDGEGFESESGVYGHRGYSGDYLFAWLAATTPFSNSVWRLMGKLGSRWLFLSMGEDNGGLTPEKLRENYAVKVAECREAVRGFLYGLFQQHGGARTVAWNPAGEDETKAIKSIIKLGEFIRRARGVIEVSSEGSEDGGKTYAHPMPLIEGPERVTTLLYNLAKGYALLERRTYITQKDVEPLVEIARSSMPYARQRIVAVLAAEGGPVATGRLMDLLKCSRPTALHVMKELELLELVEADYVEKGPGEEGEPGRKEKRVRLRPEYLAILSRNVSEDKEDVEDEPAPHRQKGLINPPSKAPGGDKLSKSDGVEAPLLRCGYCGKEDRPGKVFTGAGEVLTCLACEFQATGRGP
jgi:hypothetical protein